jgi:hypothetical protein
MPYVERRQMDSNPNGWLKLIIVILEAVIAVLEILKNWPKGPRT